MNETNITMDTDLTILSKVEGINKSKVNSKIP